MRVEKNPDEEYVKEVKKMIKANNGHCPCQLVKSPATKCQCKMFRDQVARNEPGPCQCGLYIAVKDDEDTIVDHNTAYNAAMRSGNAPRKDWNVDRE